MSPVPIPRRRFVALTGTAFMLPLVAAAADLLDLRRPREERPPKDPGYATAPSRPAAPREVPSPEPSPTVWPRREPGWKAPRRARRPKLPKRLPVPRPAVTPAA